ncbi:MAG: SDR family oxidoreductase [Saprospiraceae bacterium]|nr:SDR family oxidoreductase [Saprospiraceae bacterium]
MKLENKTFIVTGSTSGMGKASALLFAREGANLILSGRDASRGESLAREIRSMPAQVHFIPGDVGDVMVNKTLVRTAIECFGQLDGLICHAGELGLGSISDLTIEDWQVTFRTNVDSVFYLLKFALPEMLKRPQASVVINASIAAFKSFPNHPAYCASKAAVVALARQAAVDYGPVVRINSICPGPVDTPLIHASAVAFPDPKQAVADAGKNTVMQRLGQPEDIARLVLFLASEDASWITGSCYVIDGGILAKG